MRIGSWILLLQSASSHIEWSKKTIPCQERIPVPSFPGKKVPPAGEDQEAENGGEGGAAAKARKLPLRREWLTPKPALGSNNT